MPLLLLGLTALVFLCGLILLLQSFHRRKQSGIPEGKVVYSDLDAWHPVEKPLFDPLLKLTGKPDYVVEHNKKIIPVEVKSSQAPTLPYSGHMLQLAAYCLLLERSGGNRPPYGLLRYANQTLQIDYTQQLESNLLDTLAEMRSKERRGELNRSHHDLARCNRCGYRSKCDQRL